MIQTNICQYTVIEVCYKNDFELQMHTLRNLKLYTCVIFNFSQNVFYLKYADEK